MIKNLLSLHSYLKPRVWQSQSLLFTYIIFMSKVETEILSQKALKPLVSKCYMDNTLSLWTWNREEILKFIEWRNNHHPMIIYSWHSRNGDNFPGHQQFNIEHFKTMLKTSNHTCLQELGYGPESLVQTKNLRSKFSGQEACPPTKTEWSQTNLAFGDNINHQF